jgi:uncharacterized RDD family membrane protein YckC
MAHTPPPHEPNAPGQPPPAPHPVHSEDVAGRATPAPGQSPDTLKRFLAKFLDGLVASILFWLVVTIIPGWTLAALVGAIVAGAYWLVCDGLELDFMRHRSLGKRLLGLAVIRSDGRPMDIEASVRRNWMFAIGWFSQPFGFGLGMLVSLAALGLLVYEIYKVLTEPDGHRWGDELAGTRVVEA